MAEVSRALRGRVQVVVRDHPGGPVRARLAASNIVLRQGAELVARLFAGADGGLAVDAVGVGFGTEGAQVTATALVPPPAEAGIAPAALRSPLTAADFSFDAAGDGLVRVFIGSTFSPTVDLIDVTEAGLLAGPSLYNQVVFDPVDLRVGQDVTFFWEIDFPFGH